MNTTIVLTILMGTLIVAGFGFVIGQGFSDQSNRRRSATRSPASAGTPSCWITSSKRCWTACTTSAHASPLFQKASKNPPPKLHCINSWSPPPACSIRCGL